MATTEMIGSVASNANNSLISESSSVGKEDFLKLLVTQLQNQDPLDPAESTEFTAQLAQFSSLEQLTNVNENLEYMHLYQASINNAQAVNFIGKTITVSGGSTVGVSNGVADNITFELPENAANVTVSIYDASGNLKAAIEPGALEAGSQSVNWDGLDLEGNQVPDGDYTFEVAAVDSDGNAISVSTLSKATVTGVTFEGGTTYLIAGGKKIPLSDVVEVTGGPEA